MAEVAAALAAKHRAPGGINRRKFNEPISLFINHCNTQYQLITADRPTLDLTVELTQRHRLRGCDSIQLATALINNDRLVVGGLSSLTFLAADADLLVAAQAEQLTVDNPNSHP